MTWSRAWPDLPESRTYLAPWTVMRARLPVLAADPVGESIRSLAFRSTQGSKGWRTNQTIGSAPRGESFWRMNLSHPRRSDTHLRQRALIRLTTRL